MTAATVGFAMVFRRICANRDWGDCFCGYRYGIFVSLEAYTARNTCFLEVWATQTQFYCILPPGIIGERGLHHTKLEKMSRSAVIPTIDYSKNTT